MCEGCGKTEIARRISSLAQAPFVKVEATRYTEVGIVGANTNSMVKDLLDIAITQEKERAALYYHERAKSEAEKTILAGMNRDHNEENLQKLRDGEFDNEAFNIPTEIYVSNKRSSSKLNGSSSSSDDMFDGGELLSNLFTNLGNIGNSRVFVSGSTANGTGRKNSKSSSNDKKSNVKEALKSYTQYYTDQNIDENEIINAAKKKTEQEGIIFIDEIDKLASGSDEGGGGSYVRSHSLKEGVQKELLTLLEGTSVMTKYGPVSTTHILFIASGAFHTSAVSDLLPELQGRLPVRVELKSLDMNDLRRVLSEKKYNLINVGSLAYSH